MDRIAVTSAIGELLNMLGLAVKATNDTTIEAPRGDVRDVLWPQGLAAPDLTASKEHVDYAMPDAGIKPPTVTFTDHDVAKLTSDNSSLMSDVQRLTSELRAHKDDIAAMQRQASADAQQLDIWRGKLDAAEQKLAVAEGDAATVPVLQGKLNAAEATLARVQAVANGLPQLNKLLADKTAEVDALKADIARVNAALDAARAELQQTRAELAKAQAAAADADKLRADLAAAAAQVAAQADQIAALQRDIADHVAKLQDTTAADLIKQLEAEVAALRARIATLEAENARLRKENADLADKLRQALGVEVQLRGELAAAHDLQREFDARIAELEAQLAARPSMADLAALRGKLGDAEQLHKRMSALEAENARIRADALAELQRRDEQIKRLIAELQQAKKDREGEHSVAVDSLQARIGELEAQLAAQTGYVDPADLHREIAQLQGTIAQMRDDHARAADEFARREAECAAQMVAAEGQHQRAVDLLNARINELLDQIAAKPDEDPAPLHAEIGDLKNTIGKLQGELMQARQDCDPSELAQLREAVAQAAAGNDISTQLQAEVDKLREQLAAAAGCPETLAQAQAEADKLREQLAAQAGLAAEADKLRDQLAAQAGLAAEADKLRDQLAAQAGLQAEHAASQQLIEAQRGEIAALQQTANELDRLQAEITRLEAENTRLQELISRLEGHAGVPGIPAVDPRVAELEATVAQLREELQQKHVRDTADRVIHDANSHLKQASYGSEGSDRHERGINVDDLRHKVEQLARNQVRGGARVRVTMEDIEDTQSVDHLLEMLKTLRTEHPDVARRVHKWSDQPRWYKEIMLSELPRLPDSVRSMVYTRLNDDELDRLWHTYH